MVLAKTSLGILIALAAVTAAPPRPAPAPPLERPTTRPFPTRPSPSYSVFTVDVDTGVVDVRAVRKAARGQQRAFERTRRRHLPFWNGPTGRCDEIVGRFCLWHDTDPSWNPGPEKERVRAARAKLIEALDEYVRAAPTDGWIVGQWARYLVEADRAEEARAGISRCAAETWWCGALRGYVLHALGDFADADAAYQAALSSMPAEEGCQWRDLSHLLEGDARGRYRELGCAERLELEARIWWLADPLFMVPGNERRTEHYSRRVLNRLQRGADSPYGVHWGRDLEELLVRYGWPTSWSRRRQPVYGPGRRPSITGHDPGRSFRFIPSSDLVDEFTTIASEWELEPRRPREEYLPSYANAFDGAEGGFDHQLTAFRRGSSFLLVGAYEWSTDSIPPGERLRVGLVWGPERGRPKAAVSEGAPRRGVLTTRAPAGSGVLGIEVLADEAGRAARAREGRRLAPYTGEPSLSEILLLDPPGDGAMPTSLEQALRLARPSTTVRRGERIGLLWELYGVAEGTPLEVEVSLTKPGKGFFRRAAEWLGLAKEKEPTVSLEWREQVGVETRPASRYLELQIPELSDGRYVLSASVQPAGGSELASARVLKVRGR